MKDERILTLHPEGKKGVSILRSKYDPVRSAMLKSLRAAGGATDSRGADESCQPND